MKKKKTKKKAKRNTFVRLAVHRVQSMTQSDLPTQLQINETNERIQRWKRIKNREEGEVMVERFNGCVSKRLKSGPMTLRQSSFTNGMCISSNSSEWSATNGITENEKKKNVDGDTNAKHIYVQLLACVSEGISLRQAMRTRLTDCLCPQSDAYDTDHLNASYPATCLVNTYFGFEESENLISNSNTRVRISGWFCLVETFSFCSDKSLSDRNEAWHMCLAERMNIVKSRKWCRIGG